MTSKKYQKASYATSSILQQQHPLKKVKSTWLHRTDNLRNKLRPAGRLGVLESGSGLWNLGSSRWELCVGGLWKVGRTADVRGP
jgi:hypothetical protein